MKKEFILFLTAFMLILSLQGLKSQSIEVISIDPDDYPEIKMEFFGYPTADKNQSERNYQPADFILKENGVQRTVSFVECPPENLPRFSLILVLDLSGSMDDPVDPPGDYTPKINVAKNAIRSFVQNLPYGRYEVSLVAFSQLVFLLQDFTEDPELINKALDSNIVSPFGQTDYNAAMLYDVYDAPGALRIAEKAKYRPYIIFLTDGEHQIGFNGREEVWMSDIIKKADEEEATIYSIALDLEQTSILDELALGPKNKGKVYGEVNQATIDRVYQEILLDIQGKGVVPPCDLTFIGGCESGVLEMEIPKLGASTTVTYNVPQNLLPALEVTPRNFSFENTESGESPEQDVVITARKNYVEVKGQNFLDPRIQIVDWGGPPPPFRLDKDASRNLKIRYNANDSSYIDGQIDLISSACQGNDIYPASTWIYASDIDMGTQTINQTKEELRKGVFCNRTGKTIRLYNMLFTGLNESEFKMINPPFDVDIPHDSCIEVTFRFTPSETGKRTANFVVNTSEGTYQSEIFGIGSGKAIIETVNEVNFEAVDCKNNSREMDVVITNPGALPLNISSFAIDNPDFSFVPANPGQQQLAAQGGSMTVKIKFEPANPGPSNGTLTIISDAENSPDTQIPLSGVKNEHTFSVSDRGIDFGYACPDEVIQRTIEITNTGNVEITVNASAAAPFNLPVSNWTIPAGESRNIDVAFTGAASGSESLVFTESYCSYENTVTLDGIVDPVLLQSDLLSIVASVGSSTDKALTVTNNSQRDLTVTGYGFDDAQFTLVSPMPPFDIPAGGSRDITVKYAPTVNQEADANLSLTGTPCDFSYDIELQGLPYASTTDIAIGDYQALIGRQIQIDVNLVNTQNLDQSGTSAINFDVTFLADVLRPVAPTPPGVTGGGMTTISFSNQAVNPSAGDQTVVTLNFEVLNTQTPCTDLILSNVSKADGYLVFSNISNGEFCSIPSSADISITAEDAEPGQLTTINIYLKNAQNVSDFHENINAQLKMNAYLLNPVDPVDQTVDAGMRTINLMLPVQPLNGDGLLQSIKCVAMLGNEESTQLTLENISSEKGFIDFQVQNDVFNLTGICRSGKPGESPRLFNPEGSTALSMMISPNPSGNTAELNFSLSEEGFTSILISDVLGNEVMNVHSGYLKIGSYTQELDFSNLSSGSFFITIHTPTASLTKRLNILK